MSVVYDAHADGDRVALKMLLPTYAALDDTRTAFEREARALGRLRGRHVVRVLEVDRFGELPYMALEFLDGANLAQETVSTEPPVHRLVEWVCQCCEALHEAHESGIVHRDIKPSNIMIAGQGEGRLAKVIDFGISKLAEDHTSRFRRGPVLGTPGYMAPEQLRGGRVDARTDVWALGMVLYRVLRATGERDAMGGTEHLTHSRPDLSIAFSNVVMTAIEREPRDRFPSAEALGRALTPFAAVEGPDDDAPATLRRGARGPRVLEELLAE
jgi:serine/threonine-protein kinase